MVIWILSIFVNAVAVDVEFVLCVIGEAVDLSSCDANVVASLLKQYLRELPDSLLTSRLQDRFEQVTSEYDISLYVCMYVCECVVGPNII